MKTTLFASALALGVAAAPAVQAGTHLGQPSAASHVTLIAKTVPNASQDNKCSMASFSGLNLYRVNPDGTAAATPFAVPAGQYLVVTDIEWTARGGLNSAGPFTAGWALRLDINIAKPNTPGTNNLAYTSRGLPVDAAYVNEILGDTDNLASGLVVGPGASLCPQAYQSRPSSWIARRLTSFVVHGYLSP